MLIACCTDYSSLHCATCSSRNFRRYDICEYASCSKKANVKTHTALRATSEVCTPTEADSNFARIRALTTRARKKYKTAEASKPPPSQEYLPRTLEAAPPKLSKAQYAPQQGRQQTRAPALLELDDRQLLQYLRNGHLMTSALLAVEDVMRLKAVLQAKIAVKELEALRHRVRVLCPGRDYTSVHSKEQALRELQQHGIEPVGFLQIFNLHRHSIAPLLLKEDETVNRLLISGSLPLTAARLLGTRKLRIYQDCCFVKKPGFGRTNWHSDLKMGPLDTNDYVTAWIPLRPIQEDHDSGLTYASTSHTDFALAFWRDSDELEDLDLSFRNYPITQTGKMALGDVSWHHGWTVHSAPAQPKGTLPRLALSVSYFRDGARLLPKRHAHRMQTEDQESYQDWLPDIRDGAPARHPLLPFIRV